MSKIKLLAYYLPAFHEIRENNEWYGKGFTEWDNTKRAVKLFDAHYQPRIPLEYYDLSDISTVLKQMEIAKKYNVSGFVYYHYWFNENGYKILEKPAEKLLTIPAEKRIDFCFAWANESWRKTWHDGLGESELLIEQKYGNESDWEKHFTYLLSFFKDPKYIKVNNAPMLLIYKAENIDNYEEMISYMNKRALENGFSGIHIVRMLTNRHAAEVELKCNAVVDFEPSFTLGCDVFDNITSAWRIKNAIYLRLSKYQWFSKRFLNIIDYNSFYNTLLKKKNKQPKQYYSLFTDWDNSPRKGRRATIFKGSTPKNFELYLKKIYEKAQSEQSDYIFCFAWNEWGEGGYLEPDRKYNYQYLEAVQSVFDN